MDLKEAMEQLKEAVQKDAGPEEPIEVILDENSSDSVKDLIGEDGGETSEQTTAETKKPNKPRRTRDQRIAELTYQLKKEREDRQKTEEYYRRALSGQEAETVASQKHAQAQYEHALNVKLAAVKNVFEKAVEEGDYKTQAEAQQLIGEFSAELAIAKKQPVYSQRDYAPRAPVEYQPQQASEEQITPDFEDWLDRNPWFGQDQALTQEAYQHAGELERIYRYNGMENLIGTAEFFDEVDDRLASKYSRAERRPRQADTPEPQEQKPYTPRVSPVGRGAHTATAQRTSPTRVFLTKEEAEVADRMEIRGKDGNPLSIAEKRKIYAHYRDNPHLLKPKMSGVR